MNRQPHLPDAMQARSGITMTCVVALLLAVGCRHYHTREFVGVPRPVTFENWRLYVNVRVPVPDPSPTNHLYAISALAWTLPGDVHRGDPNDYRPTAYDASLDSLRLFRVEGTNAVELSLPPPRHGPKDHPNRLLQLAYGNHEGIEIPASVSELQAQVTMTFRHRAMGKTERKVFELNLHKQERTRMEPLLD